MGKGYNEYFIIFKYAQVKSVCSARALLLFHSSAYLSAD